MPHAFLPEIVHPRLPGDLCLYLHAPHWRDRLLSHISLLSLLSVMRSERPLTFAPLRATIRVVTAMHSSSDLEGLLTDQC